MRSSDSSPLNFLLIRNTCIIVQKILRPGPPFVLPSIIAIKKRPEQVRAFQVQTTSRVYFSALSLI